jgi:hypothetical protein
VILEEADGIIRTDLPSSDGDDEATGSVGNNMVAISGVSYRTECCLLVFKAEKAAQIYEKIKEAFPIPT